MASPRGKQGRPPGAPCGVPLRYPARGPGPPRPEGVVEGLRAYVKRPKRGGYREFSDSPFSGHVRTFGHCASIAKNRIWRRDGAEAKMGSQHAACITNPSNIATYTKLTPNRKEALFTRSLSDKNGHE